VCVADHVFHGGGVGRVTDRIVIVTGDRRLGGVPQRVVCRRVWAALQIDRRFTGCAVGSAVAGDSSRGGERFGPPSSPRSEDAPDRRFGRRHPQRGGVERLSSSLVLTLVASLMAIACVVTLA
jgi:hypothetical protein